MRDVTSVRIALPFVHRLILHLTSAREWQAALDEGKYRAPSLDTDGFIHCSSPTQVEHVADWFYRDVPDLVLLCIDPHRLTSTLRWEPSADSFAGDFPHVYGPIDVEAVLDVVPWARGAEGFELPESIRRMLDG